MCEPTAGGQGEPYIDESGKYFLHLTVGCLRRCPSQIGEPELGLQGFAGEGNVGEARAAARRTPRGAQGPQEAPSVDSLVRCSIYFAPKSYFLRAERPEGEARRINL
jgi:hypothetical protein